jgi:hypothetical protein
VPVNIQLRSHSSNVFPLPNVSDILDAVVQSQKNGKVKVKFCLMLNAMQMHVGLAV